MPLGRLGERERDRVLTGLFVDHYDSMRRLAFVLIGEGALAEEIVQEAFAKAMSKWTLVARAEHPQAYLRQIVVNLCRSKIRRKMVERKFQGFFEREAKVVHDPDLSDIGRDHEIWDAVRTLPERQRACIVLRYLEDLTEPEIANVLDIPVGTVKSQLSRARGRLSDILGADILGGDA